MMIPAVPRQSGANFFQNRRPIPTVIEENTILKRQIHQLIEENEDLKKRLAGNVQELADKMKKNVMSFSSQINEAPPRKEDHERVATKYEDAFDHVFIDLPNEIPDGVHTKDEVRFAFLETFEKAYALCQTRIMETFQKSLKSLTELQEDESKFGQSRDSMDKSLSLFHQAYSLLLEGNKFDEIKTPPIDSISINALTSNMQRLLRKAPPHVVENQVTCAIQIAWEMLTLDPPAIACKPEKYTKAWHDKIWKKWKSHEFYDLVYYRPVMLYGAGGSVAVKGKVFNKKCSDLENCVNQEEEHSTSESEDEDCSCITEISTCKDQILNTNQEAIWHDVTSVPYHTNCMVMYPFCKETVDPEKTTKAPTKVLWCDQGYHQHCICTVCKAKFNKQEMKMRKLCCCHNDCSSTLI